MPHRRILSDDQLEEMVQLRERGWAVARIARHFTDAGTRISAPAVASQCLRLGADVPPSHRTRAPRVALRHRAGHIVRPFTAAEDEILLQADRRGAGATEIAKQLGRHEASVRGRLLTIARREARAEEAGQR